MSPKTRPEIFAEIVLVIALDANHVRRHRSVRTKQDPVSLKCRLKSDEDLQLLSQ